MVMRLSQSQLSGRRRRISVSLRVPGLHSGLQAPKATETLSQKQNKKSNILKFLYHQESDNGAFVLRVLSTAETANWT